jgi:hypothetical protein
VLALNLLETLYPLNLDQKYDDDLAGVGWWEILADLLNQIEQNDDFQVDWNRLNEAWAHWEADPAENGDRFAAYLHYIPVTLYGFGGQNISGYPPLELMRALFSENVAPVTPDLLINIELYDGLEEWRVHCRDRAWERLDNIESDPGSYPEPVRWLPELVRWACSCTGNCILDQAFDTQANRPWFTWDNLSEIKIAWQRARPAIRQLERLMAWYEHDPGNLSLLADFLMGGGAFDELCW